jgi:putative transposase
MPRLARIVVEGYPHHVTQRGNNKQNTFLENEDYRIYLELFENYRAKHNLGVIAYCPMPNHVHISVLPESTDLLAKTFRSCHMRYAQYFNKKYKRVGHLWQSRFYSCPMEEIHLYSTMKYIENNPVRAKLVKKAGDWKWSSARAHLGLGKSIISLLNVDRFLDIADWSEYLYLDNKNMGGEIDALKKCTYSGKPMGRDDFIENLAKRFGNRVRWLPAGRPSKK